MANSVGSFYCKIGSNFKYDQKGNLETWGWASHTNIDSADEIVPISAIENAVHDYAEFSNIREMHSYILGGAGRCDVIIVENKGMWIQATIIDEGVKTKIVEKVYRGFSIGYYIRNATKRSDGITILDDIEIFEISVVDRPMNKKCLLEHAEKIRENKNKQGGNMAKVLTKKQQDSMPDSSFAFVGNIGGKTQRLFPYTDENGKVDKDIAIASLNIINSNRPEDVKLMDEDERKKSFETITTSLREAEIDADVPVFVSDNDFGNKAMNVTDVAENMKTVQEYVSGEIKAGNESVIEKMKGFVQELFSSKDSTKHGKALDMNPTSVQAETERERIYTEMNDLTWSLKYVLCNIIWSDDMTQEDREAAIVGAFNETKEMYVDLHRELSAIIGDEDDGGGGENKTVKTNKNKKGASMTDKDKMVIDGETWVRIEDDNEQGKAIDDDQENLDKNQDETEGNNEENNENAEESKAVQELKAMVSNMQKEIKTLKEDNERLKSGNPPIGKIGEETGKKKTAHTTDRNDPNFWV